MEGKQRLPYIQKIMAAAIFSAGLCLLPVNLQAADAPAVKISALSDYTDTIRDESSRIGEDAPQVQSGWVSQDDRWSYYENGSRVESGVKMIDGHLYGFADGVSVSGLQQIENASYYFAKKDKQGRLYAAKGWHSIENDGKSFWYYFGNDFKACTSQARTISKWVYGFDVSGHMLTGYHKIGSDYYYFGIQGKNGRYYAKKKGWVKIGTASYYFKSCHALAGGVKTIGGKYYDFGQKGKMLSGKKKIGGVYYYFKVGADGHAAAVTNTKVTLGKKTYYFGADGKSVKGWVLTGGNYYYFNDNYTMEAGTTVGSYNIAADGTCERKTVEAMAQDLANRITNSSMSAQQRLRACYNYMSSRANFSYRTPYTYNGAAGWEVKYVRYMLNNRAGNCYSFASTFAYLARCVGFDARIVAGRITSASGGLTAHAWTEITIDGTTYMYDTEMQREKGGSVDLYQKTLSSMPYTYVKDSVFS